MSASFPRDGLWSKPADLRVRPVPEWGCILVYTPSRPNLHYLDAHSWLLFELCDGRGYDDIRQDFIECLPPGTTIEEADTAARDVLTTLLDSGVVQHSSTAAAPA